MIILIELTLLFSNNVISILTRVYNRCFGGVLESLLMPPRSIPVLRNPAPPPASLRCAQRQTLPPSADFPKLNDIVYTCQLSANKNSGNSFGSKVRRPRIQGRKIGALKSLASCSRHLLNSWPPKTPVLGLRHHACPKIELDESRKGLKGQGKSLVKATQAVAYVV